jgi:putative acetyltransferase
MRVIIRQERPQDIAAIHEVNERAFDEALEAKLVDVLRTNDAVSLSLVAVADEQIVGRILFTPVLLETEGRLLEGVGLGPMAVLPDFQRIGIGTRLANEGLQKLRELGVLFVVVVGHPEYYPRFGFVPASRYGIRCEWEVPDEVFMILPLNAPALERVSGLAKYREEFRTVS